MTYTQRSQTMLARTAESLFWLGRYLERAEATARILDVHMHDLIGSTPSQQNQWTTEIQSLVGIEQTHVSFEDLAIELSLDKNHPSSILQCFESAWHNAKCARDTISLELWESINVTYSRLQRTFVTDLGHSPHAFFAWIKDRSAMTRGISDTTMNRDQAWLFLHLGRTTEQIDATARLLQVKLVDADAEDWVVVLRCVGGHEAYVRAVQRPVEKETAIEFLLRETRFPKSILFLATTIESSFLELTKHINDTRHQPSIPSSLARLIASLRYPREDEFADHVLDRVNDVNEAQMELQNILNDAFFSPARDNLISLPQRLEVWI